MGKIDKGIAAVFDADPIIRLYEIDWLDLLSDFRECIFPDVVRNEIM